MKPERLRPFERVVLRLTDEGLTSSEIGWRFRRSPGHIERVIDLTRHPRSPADTAAEVEMLRPIERTVMRAREDGAPHVEIAARIRRTPAYVDRLVEMVEFKQQMAQAAN